MSTCKQDTSAQQQQKNDNNDNNWVVLHLGKFVPSLKHKYQQMWGHYAEIITTILDYTTGKQ